MTPEEELIHLRQENTRLREIIQQQQAMMDHLQKQVQALQARLSKDSHNSHLPPSSDRFERQPKSLRRKSEKKPGGQEGHSGKSLQWSLAPDEIILEQVERCEVCDQDLHAIAVSHVERRQVHDVPPPHVIVKEYRAEQKHCPACQHLTVAPFPTTVTAPIQYGPLIGATAVYLVQQQLLPLARASEVMGDLLDIQMSEGTISTLIQRCATRLADVEEHIKEALIQTGVLHQDETGLYVLGKRYWMHTTSTPHLTHYHVDRSRGQAALEAIGILPSFKGVSIHDGWAAYFLYDCEHACCNVHLLRELVFLSEEQGYVWAHALKELLLEMKEATREARSQARYGLHPLEVADWEAQFLRLLEQGDLAHPRATAPAGTRGKCKQTPGRNLVDRLRKYQKAFLCFLEDLRVDFDNNLAERDLRMIKVQQKISGTFRSLAGAQAFSRIRGYLSTLRKQGLPLLSSLQATFCGHPVLPSFQGS
jgi:transposase